MYGFHYHRATSLDDAAQRIAGDPDTKLLAGGMSLIPMMKLRLARASSVVDLCELKGLQGIEVDRSRGSLTIRAMTTHANVGASSVVRENIPAVARLAGGIGDPHCRNRGTIGGSLAHSDPAACYPSAVLSLNATIVTNQREIPADEFFLGVFETALEPGEIVTAVRFPIPEVATYIKFIQPASRFSLVGVFVSLRDGRCRVAVTGAGDRVFRVVDFEDALSDAFVPDAIEGISVSPDGLTSDIYGDPEYRAHLIQVLTKRAVMQCLQNSSV